MKRTALALLLTGLLAAPALAGEIVIPVVHRGDGVNGSVWRTGIVVSNTSPDASFPIPVTITLHRPDGSEVALTTPFAAGETLDVPDAVHSWFGLEEGGGIVRIRWDAAGTIAAWARIYNVTETGEFGQGIPALSLGELLIESRLIGLSGVHGNRSNVGVSNPWTTPVGFWVTLYDTAGLPRGAFSSVVPARSYVQYNDIFSAFQPGPLHAASVRISSSSLPLYAYGSIIRNDTGDPTFVPPR